MQVTELPIGGCTLMVLDLRQQASFSCLTMLCFCTQLWFILTAHRRLCSYSETADCYIGRAGPRWRGRWGIAAHLRPRFSAEHPNAMAENVQLPDFSHSPRHRGSTVLACMGWRCLLPLSYDSLDNLGFQSTQDSQGRTTRKNYLELKSLAQDFSGRMSFRILGSFISAASLTDYLTFSRAGTVLLLSDDTLFLSLRRQYARVYRLWVLYSPLGSSPSGPDQLMPV